MIQLTLAQIPDLGFINDVYNENIQDGTATADTEALSPEQRLAWFRQHEHDKRPIWMLRNTENETVGWMSLSDFYGRPAYRGTAEVSLYIANRYQGKGYGKAALQTLIQNGPELGLHSLLGFIFAHNTASIKLFQALGFSEWGRLPDVAHMPQGKRTLLILGKKL